MSEMHGLPLQEVVIFLAATVLVVPLASRLRLSPILGYLVAGLAIGPHGLGRLVDQQPWLGSIVISDPSGPAALAEFGVVFLLFMIGLELSFARLWAMRRLVFGLGLLQVVTTTTLIAGVAAAFANPLPAALVLGTCLALSSTAIVMELLRERRRLGSPVGHGSFAILLMQDLAVVPVLILVTVFGADDGRPAAWTLLESLGEAILMIAVILALGRLALRPLFRRIGAARSRELFLAATLLVIIATAMATSAAGLSMALGAFLAGLLFAETEYRHEIEVDIEPFKGLLLGLFFMSVGMGLDLAAGLAEAGWFLASIVGLFALKSVVIAGLGLLFGLGWRTVVEMGLLLGQAGEFAFIVVAQAMAAGFVAAETGQFMQLVAGATMLATPLVAPLAERMGRWLERHAPDLRWRTVEQAGDLTGHVIVAGYGRVGHMLGELLDRQLVPYAALDLDADAVRLASDANVPVRYGNASRADSLRRLGADRALAVAVTMDDPRATERVVATVREHWPELPVFARVRDAVHARRLLRLGATEVVLEAIEASLQLGEIVLRGVGIPPDTARALVDERREQALTDIETARLSALSSGDNAASPVKRHRGDANQP